MDVTFAQVMAWLFQAAAIVIPVAILIIGFGTKISTKLAVVENNGEHTKKAIDTLSTSLAEHKGRHEATQDQVNGISRLVARHDADIDHLKKVLRNTG